MDQIDLDRLSQFDEVWQRVQNHNHPAESHLLQDVELLLNELNEQICFCAQLGKSACGSSRVRLCELTKRLKQRYAALQLWYFLESGDIHFANRKTKIASYTLHNLRKLWQSTVKNKEMMEKCNLNGDAGFIAELDRTKAEFNYQKTVLEDLIAELLK